MNQGRNLISADTRLSTNVRKVLNQVLLRLVTPLHRVVILILHVPAGLKSVVLLLQGCLASIDVSRVRLNNRVRLRRAARQPDQDVPNSLIHTRLLQASYTISVNVVREIINRTC